MIFLWTKSGRLGSKLIRWGLDEDCSHFAVCFFEHRGASAPLIESRSGGGPRIKWLGEFLGENEIMHCLRPKDIALDGKRQADYFHMASGRLIGQEYDNRAIAFWAASAILKKSFGYDLPKRNGWGRDELIYCVEVLQAMPELMKQLEIDLAGIDLEMTSPHGAYTMLADSPHMETVRTDEIWPLSALK